MLSSPGAKGSNGGALCSGAAATRCEAQRDLVSRARVKLKERAPSRNTRRYRRGLLTETRILEPLTQVAVMHDIARREIAKLNRPS
jgi:hypothetical protein